MNNVKSRSTILCNFPKKTLYFGRRQSEPNRLIGERRGLLGWMIRTKKRWKRRRILPTF